MRSLRALLPFLGALLISNAAAAGDAATEKAAGPKAVPGGSLSPSRARNIILMIGDGMGLAQISAARYQKGRLALEGMEHFGFSYTHSLKNFVTDSSASATALATGYLILNGWVGLHPDGSRTKTLFEYAEEKGMWTGIVVTCRVTHATPASMVAHVKSRGSEDEIAEQIAGADLELILGGGWDKFLPTRTTKIHEPETREDPVFATARRPDRGFLCGAADLLQERTLLTAERQLVGKGGKPYGTRKDKKDLIAAMEKRGYRFLRTAAELMLAASGPPSKLIGLFHSGPMPRVSEGRSPSLSAMSLAALKTLAASPGGFCLMIEGSQIDWGSHANDYDYSVQEAADFDDALETVRRFLDDSGLADETLIIVTADHETGGLTLNTNASLSLGIEPKWSTTGHTGIPVPVFACGPGSEAFGGIQSHDMIGRRLIERVAGHKVVFSYPKDEHTPSGKAGDSRSVGKK